MISHPVRMFNIKKNLVSWVWWFMPVVLTTLEAWQGGLSFRLAQAKN
jgi:hypothetical protein